MWGETGTRFACAFGNHETLPTKPVMVLLSKYGLGAIMANHSWDKVSLNNAEHEAGNEGVLKQTRSNVGMRER